MVSSTFQTTWSSLVIFFQSFFFFFRSLSTSGATKFPWRFYVTAEFQSGLRPEAPSQRGLLSHRIRHLHIFEVHRIFHLAEFHEKSQWNIVTQSEISGPWPFMVGKSWKISKTLGPHWGPDHKIHQRIELPLTSIDQLLSHPWYQKSSKIIGCRPSLHPRGKDFFSFFTAGYRIRLG